MTDRPVDGDKLNAFLGQVVGDAGATTASIMVLLGDKLGLYKALAKDGPATPAELAARTKTVERYVREWANSQAAGGYLKYDSASGKYSMEPEQAMALTDDKSPAFVPGLFQVLQAAWNAAARIEEAFKNGGGVEWGHQHPALFEGTERFFRSSYIGNLVGAWLPALDGVVDKLKKGVKVADVGCGLGASTIIMAQAFPNSKFVGFDSHATSIEMAKTRAKEAGVSDRVDFQVANATSFSGEGYDLVCFFDCFHDMENPLAAAKHARAKLAADGTLMMVEPFASDNPEQNHNPIGRLFYSVSTMICVAHSMALKGPALGAQAGEARLSGILKEGGFTRVRRATETPFNIILEARP